MQAQRSASAYSLASRLEQNAMSYTFNVFIASTYFYINYSAQTAAKIYSSKSVGSMSPVPFACLFTNSIIWLYYGLLKGDLVVYGPNITGALIGVGCICSYEAMSPVFNRSVYAALVLVCLFVTGLAFCESGENIGLVGCLATILLMGAPLATLSTVIKEKSTASIPFNQSLMSFFNSLSWALYGYLVADDIMVPLSTCAHYNLFLSLNVPYTHIYTL